MTTLVLSGGGSKGAFQAGVESTLRTVYGMSWDAVYGVSVGALNAAMIGQGKYTELRDIWRTVTNDAVYRKHHWLTVAWRLFVRKKYGAWDNTPLRRLIEQYVDPAAFRIPTFAGYVDVLSGAYLTASAEDADFRQAVLASTSIPIVWPPIAGRYVDGGVRNMTPLADAIDGGADRIVVILCNSMADQRVDHNLGSFVTYAARILDIITHEVMVNDIRELLRINDLVRQAPLTSPSGTPYRYIPITVIEPPRPLGSSLEFSPAVNRERWRIGANMRLDVE